MQHLYHYAAKLLFLFKRARPVFHTAVALLSARLKGSDEEDVKKPKKFGTWVQQLISITLWWSRESNIVDQFCMKHGMKRHAGGIMTLWKVKYMELQRYKGFTPGFWLKPSLMLFYHKAIWNIPQSIPQKLLNSILLGKNGRVQMRLSY